MGLIVRDVVACVNGHVIVTYDDRETNVSHNMIGEAEIRKASNADALLDRKVAAISTGSYEIIISCASEEAAS